MNIPRFCVNQLLFNSTIDIIAQSRLFKQTRQRAVSLIAVHAEALLKGTNVDGVYDCNSQDNNLTFEHITFRDLVSRGATSMDMMALTFCEDNVIPGQYSHISLS